MAFPVKKWSWSFKGRVVFQVKKCIVSSRLLQFLKEIQVILKIKIFIFFRTWIQHYLEERKKRKQSGDIPNLEVQFIRIQLRWISRRCERNQSGKVRRHLGSIFFNFSRMFFFHNFFNGSRLLRAVRLLQFQYYAEFIKSLKTQSKLTFFTFTLLTYLLKESSVLDKAGGLKEVPERDWYRGRSKRYYPRGKRGLTDTMRQRTPVPLIEVALLRQRDQKHSKHMKFHRNGGENCILLIQKIQCQI